jgi:hypothetical protein
MIHSTKDSQYQFSKNLILQSGIVSVKIVRNIIVKKYNGQDLGSSGTANLTQKLSGSSSAISANNLNNKLIIKKKRIKY